MIDWLLHSLADRLGVAPAQPGEATTPRIRFEQPWSQTLFVFTALGSVALICWLYRREGKASTASKVLLAGLRIALVLLAMFMLSEAVLSVERTGLPYLTILIDDSASQGIVDQYDKPEVKTALDELAAASRPEAKGKTAAAAGRKPDHPARHRQGLDLEGPGPAAPRAGEAAQGPALSASRTRPGCSPRSIARSIIAPAVELVRAIEPIGAQSRLGDGVRQVLTELRGAPPSAIVLLSDGQTTEGESLSKAAELAARKGVPLFTVGLGSAEPARDIELTELLVDDVVFVDDAVRFQAKLLARGFQGEKVMVRLKELEPGSRDPKTARELESNEVDAPANGQPKRVELVYHPKTTGERTFILEVDPRPRELQTDNNRIERAITVRKEKLKVLYVDTEPRYEFRYLKNYLERDETIDLNIVLLSSDPAYSQQDRSALSTFPAAKDALFAYDVVLFGDADTSFLSHSQMQNLVEFVTEKGGGVLFVAGELFNPLSYRGTPLELLLPIELADARNPTAVGTSVNAFRPELTLEGRSSPIFRFGDNEAASMQIWEQLPELFWYFEAPRKKPAALVLAEHPTAIGSDGKLPLVALPFRRGRQGRCSMRSTTPGAGGFAPATSTSGGSGSRRSGSWRDRSSSANARPRSRPTASAISADSRSSSGSASPIPAWPRPAATSRSRSKNAARAHASWLSSSCPERGTCSKARCRKPPKGSTRSGSCPRPILEGPIATASFRVDAPVNEFERIEMNEPELIRAAESTGGKFYTPLDRRQPAQGPAQAVQGPARHRSADPALEHLARADLVPLADHGGVGFQKTQTNGMISVSDSQLTTDHGRLVDDSSTVGIANPGAARFAQAAAGTSRVLLGARS